MGTFQALRNAFTVILAFFPRWFSTGILGLLVAFGVNAVIGIAQRLKNLFWPF